VPLRPKPPRTLVTRRLYFGLDPVRLREASGRVLARVVGLPPERANVSADDLRHDLGIDTTLCRSVVEEMVAEGLLSPRDDNRGYYRLTSRFAELAAARVVEPLGRAKARTIVSRACEIARTINDDWARNPLVVTALAPYGSYLSREPHLDALPLGVVVASRPATRRARFRMQKKLEGARDIRMAFRSLSSFVEVELVTAMQDLPRPHAVVFQAEPDLEP
jgi:DNA-binding IscR family transcriptional regulator